MENTFSFRGRSFSIGKLDVFDQFHVVRVLGPALVSLVPKLNEFKEANAKTEKEKINQFANLASPFLKALSSISKKDSETVLKILLTAAQLQQNVGFATICRYHVETDEYLMMVNDLDFPTMMQVASRVFMNNLAGFFDALPQ